IRVNQIEFDIWEIENTWAFKENKVQINFGDYEKKLQDTVFLNIDSIVYNLNTQDYYNKKYENAMENKSLDVVLEENPYIELNLLRAILFKKKYNMDFSDKLSRILSDFVDNNNNYLKLMEEVQIKHYRTFKIESLDLDKEI
ncbi:hypothetical protein QQO51_02335, partial [Clostridioides difficile]